MTINIKIYVLDLVTIRKRTGVYMKFIPIAHSFMVKWCSSPSPTYTTTTSCNLFSNNSHTWCPLDMTLFCRIVLMSSFSFQVGLLTLLFVYLYFFIIIFNFYFFNYFSNFKVKYIFIYIFYITIYFSFILIIIKDPLNWVF